MPKEVRGQKVRPCYYCVNNKALVDFKEIQILRRFVSSFFKIAPRKRTGLCAKHQRRVGRAVKQARIAGLIAFVPK